MPSVVVLRRQSVDQNGAAIESLSQFVRAEQSWDGEPEAFDPVFRRHIDCGIGGETAISCTCDGIVVFGHGDWTCVFFDLSGEELVEGVVLFGIRLDLRAVRHVRGKKVNRQHIPSRPTFLAGESCR